MTHLSVVPKILGKEAIKSNCCGDAKASDIHRAESLLMGSIPLVLSWYGGSVGDTRKLQRERQRTEGTQPGAVLPLMGFR